MGNETDIIAAIDIGTTKIVAVIARRILGGSKFEILGAGLERSVGIRRGVVESVDDTVRAIVAAMGKARAGLDVDISDVFVGIAGQHVIGKRNRAVMHFDEPTRIDIGTLQRLKEQMLQTPVEAGEEILDAMPQSFIVNNYTGLDNPCGMTTTTLEGNYHVVVGRMTMIGNIRKCITLAGMEVRSLFLEPVASAEAVLSNDEKQAGVALVDIGGGTSDLAVFKNGKILHTAVIPLGGNSVTNDIKKSIGIMPQQAEELKIKHGYALTDDKLNDTVISIQGLKGRDNIEIYINDLAKIIQARMEEILHAVMFQIESIAPNLNLAAGIVLTGGGSLLKNVAQLASAVLKNKIRIAYPNNIITGEVADKMRKPQFSTAIGLLVKGDEFNIQKKQTIFDKINKDESSTESDTQSDPNESKKNHKFITNIKNTFAKLFEEE